MELLWGALFGHGARDGLETCVVWEAGALAHVTSRLTTNVRKTVIGGNVRQGLMLH